MVNLHTIGDSHSIYGWEDIKIGGLNITIHHLGDMTCAWFGMEKPIVEVDEKDWVCFCFGEIDCRNNIGKHENYKEIIEKIADNYFNAISLYKAEKIFVFNVVPAVIQSTAAGNPWPCVGTDDERKEFVRYMNECFKKKCNEFGFVFFDVHDKYAENGFFNLKYRDNCVHIIDPVFLIEFLNENINRNPVL